MTTRHRAAAPAVLTAVLAAGTAVGISALVPALGALTVAVVLGVVTGGALPGRLRDGLAPLTTRLLRAGVVLLGLQLGVGDVAGLGTATVLAVVVTVAVGFSGTLLLGRLLGVPPGLTLLVATGFSICGASAVAAVDGVARTEKEEVATAVTLVTLYGTAAIVAVPVLGGWLGLSPHAIGAWAGASVHEVAQVVAAAAPAGAAAVSVAVVVKLTRVLLLAPIVAGVGAYRRRHSPVDPGERRPPIVPLFVLGFLAAVAVRSTGLLPAVAVDTAHTVSTALFAAALFGLGTAVRPLVLLRTGRRGLVLGAASTLLVGATSLVALGVAA